MPKKNPPTRVVERPREPAPAPEPSLTPDEFSADIEAAVSDPEPRETEPRRDPAQVIAEVMLTSILSRPSPNLEDVRAPGAVICVMVPGSDWLDPVRRAWRRDISGQTLTYKASGYADFSSRVVRTYTFCPDREPSKADRDRHNELFAGLVGHGHSAVGFAADAAWLPPDLVAAMDYRIVLGTPAPGMLAEMAGRLSGSPATFELTEEEAARVTPRLLRLSVRPNQSADAYLLKLRDMLAREAVVAVASVQKPRTVRDEPTLERIHGMDEAVAWGFQLRDDLYAYRKGERSWSDVDGGLLLSGPPGTGKTLFARALARTCGVPLVSGSYGAWLSTGTAHQGDLLKAMRHAFRDAKALAPAILFIDEVDAFADRARVKHFPEWHTEVVNTLLAEIDGVEDRQGVIVIGACNHPGKLDPALVRSGRLDRHIRIGTPDAAALSAILRVHLGDELPGADLGHVGMLLLGSTGADVERLVRGARRRARQAGRAVEMADVVLEAGGGDGRSGEDLLLAAVHEAGHAVSAVVLGHGIEGVTLRGSVDGDGLTRMLRGSNQITAHDVYDRLVVHLSGRAAEEVVLKRVTSGAGGVGGSDLQRATLLAVRSAAELGLEEDHGLSWTPLPDQESDLSAMLAQDPRLATLVRTRLASAYGSALNLIERKQDAVRAIAEHLVKTGALGADEVCSILGVPECRS